MLAVDKCANTILFISMMTIAACLVILVRRMRIGMAVGKRTWIGLASFIALRGIVDLFRAGSLCVPLQWYAVMVDCLTASLAAGGAAELLLQVKRAVSIPLEELSLRYKIYRDPEQENFARLHEMIAQKLHNGYGKTG